MESTDTNEIRSQDLEIEGNPVHTRFKGAPWYGHYPSLIIGGAGGIGSWLTLFLARQGHDIFLFDYDNVERHNMGGQFYDEDSLGFSKIQAAVRLCREFADREISTFNEKFTEQSIGARVMFSCFDNMNARRDMINKWLGEYKKHDGTPSIFIDGRLNAETAEIFCITNEEEAHKWCTEYWFEDSKIPDAPCTFKATSHCGAILAGMMTAVFNNYIANFYEKSDRSVPFKTSIWLPVMMVLSE